MNDENPYQSPQAASAPPTVPLGNAEGLPPDFKDRSTGLMVFGVLEILAGLFAALLIPLMIAGLLMAPNRTLVQPAAMIPIVLMYGLAAIGGVWLGVGSIQARRWARSLSLVIGWIWLVVGVMGTAAMLFIVPRMALAGPQGTPASANFMFLGVMLATIGCVYLVPPIALVLFYGSRHVAATCRWYDPRPNWTDRCPLPVLAMSLVLGFWALSTLGGMGSNYVLPVFGVYLSGPAGAAAYPILGGLFAYLAWAAYRLHRHAWWLTAVVIALWSASALVTFLVAGPAELYRQAGMPPEQIEAIQKSGVPLNAFGAGGAAVGLLLAAYAVWLRRYFKAPLGSLMGEKTGS